MRSSSPSVPRGAVLLGEFIVDTPRFASEVFGVYLGRSRPADGGTGDRRAAASKAPPLRVPLPIDHPGLGLAPASPSASGSPAATAPAGVSSVSSADPRASMREPSTSDIRATAAPFRVRVVRSTWGQRVGPLYARELELLRSVDHPGIVGPIAGGFEGGRAISVHSLSGLTSLRQMLASRSDGFSVEETATILAQIAAPLDVAHGRPEPLTHGSLSPDNIYFTEDNEVRIFDFGVVMSLTSLLASESTRYPVLLLPYSAPEIIRDGGPLTPRSDIFGLASLAFELLTGKPAFPATNGEEAQQLLVRGKLPSLRAQRAVIPAQLDPLLVRAWSREPTFRTSRASDFAREFAEALSAPVRPDPVPRAATLVGLAPNSSGGASSYVSATSALGAPAPLSSASSLASGDSNAVATSKVAPLGAPQSGGVGGDRVDTWKKETSKQDPDQHAALLTEAFARERAARSVPPGAAPPALTAREGRRSTASTLRAVIPVTIATRLLMALIISGGIVIAGVVIAVTLALRGRSGEGPRNATASSVAMASSSPSVAPSGSTSSVSASASADPWSRALKPEDGPRPSQEAMDEMFATLKPQVLGCIKERSARAVFALYLQWDGPTGKATYAEVSPSMRKAPIHGCLLKAMWRSRVPPFRGHYWGTYFPISPDTWK